MTKDSKKRNIEETTDNTQENARARADSLGSLGSFDLLLEKIAPPEVGEDIILSPQELELKEIEAQFKSDMSNLTNNRNKKLLNLFGRTLKENDTETCEKILNSDHFDINTQDGNGHTALHYSSRIGKDEVTSLLINKGADIRIKAINGNTALHISTFFDQNKNTEVLLDEAQKNNFIDIIADKNNNSFTPMNYSESHTFIKLVKSANKVEGSKRDAEIKKAYNYAKDEILLDFKDKDGNTALHHATAKDDYHTAKLLLKNGANTNIKNKQEQTPKDLVSEKSKFNSTFSLLFRENNLKKGKKSRPRSKIPSKSGSYAENVKKPDSESRNR